VKKRVPGGFSFVEVLIAAIILGISLTTIILNIQQTQHSAMDAYYENLAVSLAKEPIEVFQTFGYAWTRKYWKNPFLADYPLDEETPIGQDPGSVISRPVEAESFLRSISLTSIGTSENPGIQVAVHVTPARQSRAARFLSKKNGVILYSNIFGGPQ
jgi:type II secretory pathway pseudopilin PulG